MWLIDNGHTINRRELQRIYARLPKPDPIENGIELKRKVFRELYYYFPDDVQTLLLVMLASGMRLGEALHLNRDDVIWNKERPGKAEFLYGALIGIPNFFSSKFLIAALKDVPAVIAYPTYSVATILIVTLTGVFIFKETLSKRQWYALIAILVALVLLNI